jgi:hypothetical protein
MSHLGVRTASHADWQLTMNPRPAATDRIRLRRPEYTGRNRCVPCTVVNLLVAAALTVVVATVSPAAAAVVGLVALAAIYLRGYLVPGTPALTKRYLPASVLDWFDASATHHTTNQFDPGALLVQAGVLTDTDDGTDLVLDPVFATAWAARTGNRLAASDGEQAALAAQLDVRPGSLAVTNYETGLSAHLDDELLGSWESRTAFFADMAGMELLAPLVADWDGLPVAARSETAATLRLFAELCPDCGGTVELDEQTVESCCSTHQVVAATCDTCGVRLLEVRLTDAMRDADAAGGPGVGDPTF